MKIHNVSAFPITLTDLRIPSFGTAQPTIQPDAVVIVYDEDAEKSLQLAAALLAGTLVHVDNTQPQDGTLVSDSHLATGSEFAAKGSNSDITSLHGITTPLSVAQGGTAGNTASAARASLSAAVLGANSDITSLTGLSTPLSIAQGGTAGGSASAARTALSVPLKGSAATSSSAAAAATQTGSYVQADVQTIATLANDLQSKLNALITIVNAMNA